ncbi:tetratricopeptide repeat protein [Desulfogranum japonicum]|uniref:hypothetical protein n=1 Tax=Desulfogranum japonicum TaxID=231447 RepID=UPI001294676D|nr:hypothetical protein [Desulfogranum japonicum]
MGIDEEYFYIQRGNYFYKLRFYSLALGNYKTALEKFGSTDQFLKPSIAYCYLVLGNYIQSQKLYREAYLVSKHPDILVGLVCAELNLGNDEAGIHIFEELLSKKNEFTEYHKEEVIRIQDQMLQDKIIKEKYV